MIQIPDMPPAPRPLPIHVIVFGRRAEPMPTAEIADLFRRILGDLRVRCPAGVTIHHGDCRGIDRWAGAIAESLRIPVVKHPADWATYGRAAGPYRNRAMLGSILSGPPAWVLGIGFNGGSGTRDMARVLYDAAVTTWRIDG